MSLHLHVVLASPSSETRTQLFAAAGHSGLNFEAHVVETQAALETALLAVPDLILLDAASGAYEDAAVYAWIQAHSDDTALIVVNGPADELAAVHALRGGAVDYISEKHAGRLSAAMVRAIHLRDLRRQKRTVDAAMFLRERALVATSHGVLICSAEEADYPIVYCNPTFSRITGYGAGEVLGRNCRFLQGRETDRESVHYIRQCIARGVECTVELLNYRKDGTPFWNSLSVSPIRDEDGRITHFVGTQSDVSERRWLEQQLHQTHKMEAVGRLAGGIAHDFRNLLTAIKGYNELAMAALPAESPVQRDLQEVSHAVERAGELTSQLLSFSRQPLTALRVVDLNTIIVALQPLLSRMIGEDVALHVHLEEGLPPLRADRNQLEQILLNLSVNARDAMPRGGRLRITTRYLDEASAATRLGRAAEGKAYVALQVEDNGVGMDEATLRHMFEPFYSTKGETHGTGLGLSIVYGVVNHCQGHIRVSSALGQGSRFELYFPAVQAALDDAAGSVQVEEALPGTETILVVDDEERLCQLVERILRGLGYGVLTATTPEMALSTAEQYEGRIALLLTDVVMLGMNGYELAAQVMAKRPEIRVLYLSGYSPDAFQKQGIAIPEDALLSKPFSAVTLATKVRRILDA